MDYSYHNAAINRIVFSVIHFDYIAYNILYFTDSLNMKNSFKEIVRRAMRDNPELPVRFVISSLKALQEMKKLETKKTKPKFV